MFFTCSSCYFFNDFADIKLDVRDMSPFHAGCFDAVIDKGAIRYVNLMIAGFKILLIFI